MKPALLIAETVEYLILINGKIVKSNGTDLRKNRHNKQLHARKNGRDSCQPLWATILAKIRRLKMAEINDFILSKINSKSVKKIDEIQNKIY